MNEKRKIPRVRALKGARIVFNNGNSYINCLVRNLSSEGAMLTVSSVMGIPQDFDLLFDDGRKQACAVIWRNPESIGVSFPHQA